MGGGRRTIGGGALAAALVAGLVGCVGEQAATPTKTVKPSAISGGVRTCTGEPDPCTESGTLRWSRPLLDHYRADNEPGDFFAIRPSVLNEHGDPIRVLGVDDMVYFAAGSQLLAVDAATGKLRWSQRYPKTAVGGFADLRIVAGRLLVAHNLLNDRQRYLSVDPRTGDHIVIPVRDREYDLLSSGEPGDRKTPRNRLLLATNGAWEATGTESVRSIDPTTGRTVWRAKVSRYWSKTVHDGVLYLDDYRERDDIPKDREQRLETRAIQRVDLRTGERLPDIELPKQLWGKHPLSYVADNGTIVLRDVPADGGTKYAVDRRGRRVDQIPEEDDTTSEEREWLRAKGPEGKAQRLVGYDASGKRWTGPRMMAAEELLRTDTRPRLAVAVACAPDGIEASELTSAMPGLLCTKPRLFAVTW